ncbi:amidohydrolase family protein [uncultured Dokdonia sp.]|uniref:amidohydrolase family protein n=1 Tax=uncultured Dokdonia sp. TaxID=575653 RepID=UPI0026099BCD|nr:amidohydrolase family protein [uncultured Dokdonia sp.]
MNLSVRSYYLIAFVSLSILNACQEHTFQNTYDLAIKNITIINEKGISDGDLYTVYIKDGLIAEIDPLDTSKSLFATKEIDGSGKYILPGFWDNHTHFRGGPELVTQNELFLKQFIKYGITTVRDAGGDLTPQVQQWNKEIQNGTRIGPTIYTSGPKLDGKNARWAGSIGVSNSDEISKALDSLQSINVDYVKLYDSTLSGEQYLEIIKQAESRGMITSGHMPFTVTLDETIDAGIDNIEHLYYILKGCSSQEKEITAQIKEGKLGFWGSMAQLIETYDEDTAQRTFKKLKDNNVYVTPTLFIGDILSYMDEVDHNKDSYLALLEEDFIATYEGRVNSALNASDEAKQNRKDLQEFFLQLVKKLDDAGVTLLSGSDSGAYNAYTYPGPSLHGELREMTRAGISTSTALSSMYDGAHFLNKSLYQFSKGGIADLVILNSNPLRDIKATEDIWLVIKNGAIIHSND